MLKLKQTKVVTLHASNETFVIINDEPFVI
jgi:hypothetical protein